MPEPASMPKVALVVGAGGPTGGPFSWSALDALTKRTGWEPASASEVIGTSAGAFVASKLTQQLPADPRAVEALRELSNPEDFPVTLAVRVAGGVRRFLGRIVARFAPMSREPAEYTVSRGPFHPTASAVTVRRRGAKRVQHRLRANDAEAVVRASAAIPFANRPVDVSGEWHVDGATYSANNVDLVGGNPDVVVVISPMVPATGGTLVSRAHRAQLACEISNLERRGCAVVAVLPSEGAHSVRRDRERFAPEGAAAVGRLGSEPSRD